MQRHPLFRRLFWPVAILFSATFVLSGCMDDPYDPETWIKKLDDPAEVKGAIIELQHLKKEKGIEKAIEPLAKVWDKQNRSEKVLKVIIELAEEGEGGPHWDKAVPVLRTAVDEFDVGDDRSIQNAIAAADALGRSKDKESIQTLIRAVNKNIPKLSPGQRVRLAAIAALGKFGNEKRSVEALLKVLNENPDEQLPNLFAAAAMALEDARSEDAIEPLTMALFKIAPIFPQCRRALIAIGQPVVPKLIKIFQGKDEALNQLAKDNKFNIKCSPENMGEESTCVAPSNLEYKSAMLLGDFYATEATKVLAAGLKDKPLPSFFEQGIPGPSQHTAILDALRKIGDLSAGDAVWAYIVDPETDDGVKPIAIDVYSFLSDDTKNLDALGKMVKDDEAEEQIRMAAGLTYGRLVRSKDEYEPIMYMIDRYKKEADKNEDKAKKAKAEYDSAKKAYEEADKKSMEKKGDTKLAAAAKKAKAKMQEKEQESGYADGRVAGYRGFQRTFEQNLARAHTGVTCKKDPQCYVAILDKQPDEIGKEMASHLKDWKNWSDQEKTDLKVAAVDRALLEIRKMGAKARPVVDKLLEKADSTDRITRQGVLLALVKVAELPCEKCATRLNEVIEAQKDQSTLQALAVETQAVHNYFLWAGKK